MAHLIDTFAFTGQIAWHRLGTRVGDRPTDLATIYAASGLDAYTIGVEPLRTADGIAISSHRAIVRRDADDTPTVFGCVSPQYTHLPAIRVFDLVDSALSGARWETMGGLRRGAQSIGLVSLSETLGTIDDGSVGGIRPYISVSIGHDGKRGISIGATTVRVVCANTLAIAEREIEGGDYLQVRARHTQADLDTLRDKVNRACDAYLGQLLETKRQIDALRETRVSKATMRELLTGLGSFDRYFALTYDGIGVSQYDTLPDDVSETIPCRTLWDVVNSVTQFASRQGPAAGQFSAGAKKATTAYKRALAYAGA